MIALGLVALALLLFVWAGYPALVALLARFRITRVHAAGTTPTVSVILATRARQGAVRNRVENLLASEYPPHLLQVVVTADAAREESLHGVAQLDPGRVVVVDGASGPGKPAALNAGVDRAIGEVLVFADTAQRFDPDAIRWLAAALADPSVGAVSGMLELHHADQGRWSLVGLYWRLERWLRAREATLHSAIGVTGAIYAMRRSLWRALPADTLLDDLHGPMRLVMDGHRVGFESRAIARDARDFSAEEEHRRKERTLAGVLQLCASMPALLVPWRNPVWFQFVCHKLLRFATPFLLAALAIALVGGIGQKVHGAQRTTLLVLLASTVLLVAIHPRLRRRALEALWMQVAILRALWRGLRGDWRVW